MSKDSAQFSSCFESKKKLQRICMNSLKIREECGFQARNSVQNTSSLIILNKVVDVAKIRSNESKQAWAKQNHKDVIKNKGVEFKTPCLDTLIPENIQELGHKLFDK